MTKTITIPEDLCTQVQKANIERDARRDILIYIMQNNIDLSEERISKYQKEFEEKFFAFEQAKSIVEKNYVKAAYENAISWSLDYATQIVTITIPEEKNK